jgi:hypothetical protein
MRSGSASATPSQPRSSSPLATTLVNTVISFPGGPVSPSRSSPSAGNEFSSSILSIFPNQNVLYVVIGFGSLLLFIPICCCFRFGRKQLRGFADKRPVSVVYAQTRKINDTSVGRPQSYSVTEIESQYGSTTHNSTTSMSTDSTSSSTNMTQVGTEMGLSLPGYLQFNYARDFKLSTELTRGGYGTVYLAQVMNLSLAVDQSAYYYNMSGAPFVIIKQYHSRTFSEEELKMFYQEISLMEYFKSCPYIATLIGYTESPYSIVMKYYVKGSLRKWLWKSVKRPKKEAISFFGDITKGVMFLHRKGVVHSDLKPDNVLLDEDIRTMKLRCLITDFGICRIISDDIIVVDGFVPLTVNALSLSYASPERIVYGKNGSKAISPKIYPTWDIYSLGIIMFELLNNKKSIY